MAKLTINLSNRPFGEETECSGFYEDGTQWSAKGINGQTVEAPRLLEDVSIPADAEVEQVEVDDNQTEEEGD